MATQNFLQGCNGENKIQVLPIILIVNQYDQRIKNRCCDVGETFGSVEGTLYIGDSVQDCSSSIANALELLQSCTKPSIFL